MLRNKVNTRARVQKSTRLVVPFCTLGIATSIKYKESIGAQTFGINKLVAPDFDLRAKNSWGRLIYESEIIDKQSGNQTR